MTKPARLFSPTLQRSLQWIAFLLSVFGALAVITGNTAQAQTLTILHTFSGPDGYDPQAGVTLDAAGNLYGTTNSGGSQNCAGGSGCGTVFKLTHRSGGWVLTSLHEFQAGSDGAFPDAGVVFGPDGTLYGTTDSGGPYGRGTVFNLRPPANVCHAVSCPWTETVLYSFTGGSDGDIPGAGNLVFDQQGNVYGTTQGGGRYGQGTVFELTRFNKGWTESVIYNFGTNQDVQCGPIGGVIFDRSGNLWGTDSGCNVEGEFGTVFELTPSGSGWTATLIHAFQDTFNGNTPDGAFPFASLTLDSSGNFYGTTLIGPPDPSCPSLGTVFEVNAAGEFSTLHFFPPGSGPECMNEVGLTGAVSLDAQGNLYGTQYATPSGYGGVFEGGPLGWSELEIFPVNSGGLPFGGVALDANGNVYGTTSTNGPDVWEITP